MSKGCLIGCAAIVALGLVFVVMIAAIGFFAFGATAPAVAAADSFLDQLAQGNTDEAYQLAGRSFREKHNEASFDQLVARLQLDKFSSVWWSDRQVKNNVGHLEGTMTTRSGSEHPLVIDLIYEEGGWRVTDVSALAIGTSDRKENLPLPSNDELVELVRESLLSFNRAVLSDDFAPFHADVSRLWQQQTTAEKIAEIFHDFVAGQIDIGEVAEAEPIFSAPPTIDEEGLLHAKGYFLIDTRRVGFDLTYTYEHPHWKLLGIQVSVKQIENDPGQEPTEETEPAPAESEDGTDEEEGAGEEVSSETIP